MGWSTLLEWLGTTRERMEAQRRKLLWAFRAFFVGSVGCTLFQLRMAWITDRSLDWMDVWLAVFFTGMFTVSLVIGIQPRVIQFRREYAVALREAAAAGDDERAPIAVKQPERLPAVERAFSFEQVSRVKPVPTVRAQNGLLVGSIWLVYSIVSISENFASSNQDLLRSIGLAYIFSLVFGCVFIFQGLNGRKKVSITADAQSFTWHQGRWRMTVEWSDVRAFCQIEHRELLEESLGAVYYLLATERDVLLWQRPMRRGAKGYEEAERAASLAATYVSVPLRDLTREATRQAEIVRRIVSTQKERAHLPPRPAGWKRRTLYPFFATLLVELLLLTTCVGAFLAQPRLYAGCLAQAQAHTPLFADTLTHDDGRWPMRAASGEDDSNPTLTYNNRSYTLANVPGDQQVSAWTSQTFTDAVVVVTGAPCELLRCRRRGANFTCQRHDTHTPHPDGGFQRIVVVVYASHQRSLRRQSADSRDQRQHRHRS